MPNNMTPIPTPTKTGNPNDPDVAAVTPPAMNNATPAMKVTSKIKPAMMIGTFEPLVALILSIDSRNSSGLMMPLSWAGKVGSNPAMQHPAREKEMLEMRSDIEARKHTHS